MTTPDAPGFNPDEPDTGGCLWVEIEGESGDPEWVHFCGLSHNAFVRFSQNAKNPPWQTDSDDPDLPIRF